MNLIVNIEQEFNIRIEAEDTESDEFRYIEGLVEMIEKKL